MGLMVNTIWQTSSTIQMLEIRNERAKVNCRCNLRFSKMTISILWSRTSTPRISLRDLGRLAQQECLPNIQERRPFHWLISKHNTTCRAKKGLLVPMSFNHPNRVNEKCIRRQADTSGVIQLILVLNSNNLASNLISIKTSSSSTSIKWTTKSNSWTNSTGSLARTRGCLTGYQCQERLPRR